MKACFSLETAPELTQFPVSVRRLLFHRGLTLMRRDHRLAGVFPTFLCVCGAVLGWLAGLFVQLYLVPLKPLPEDMELRICFYLGVPVVVAVVGGFVGLQFQLRRLRPYLHQAIEGYEAGQRL